MVKLSKEELIAKIRIDPLFWNTYMREILRDVVTKEGWDKKRFESYFSENDNFDVDLSGANFSNMHFGHNYIHTAGVNLAGANFSNSTVKMHTMGNSLLKDANFEYAEVGVMELSDLIGADLKNATIRCTSHGFESGLDWPKDLNLSGAILIGWDFQTDHRRDKIIADGQDFSNTTWINCEFDGVNLRNANFTNAKFIECWLTNCDLSGSKLVDIEGGECFYVQLNEIKDAVLNKKTQLEFAKVWKKLLQRNFKEGNVQQEFEGLAIDKRLLNAIGNAYKRQLIQSTILVQNEI